VHAQGAADLRVEERLALEGFGRFDFGDGNAASLARGQKLIGIVGGVGGRGDEEAAGVLDGGRDDFAEQRILGGALTGRLRIANDLSATGVEQTVITTAGAMREVALFEQHGFEAAQGGVPRGAEAGGAAAKDEEFRAESHAK